MMRSLAILTVAMAAAAPAPAADSQYKVLVVAMPSRYHFEYIPTARDSLERLARLHAFDLDWSSKADALEGELGQYAAIVLLNTPVEDLNAAQRARFEAYMRAGGNAVIVHRAAIAQPDAWPWYEKLVGRSVGNHPMLQTGVVTVTDRRFPATFGVPDRWIWSDEFYVTSNPYNIRINTVLRVDEGSYDPTKIWPGQVARAMGVDHPIAWYRREGRSRVFVTTLGHEGVMYRDPTYLDHLMGGLWWTATGRGEAPGGRP